MGGYCEDLDLVGLGGVQFDDGAGLAASPDGSASTWCRGPHEIDGDFIEGWLDRSKLRNCR